ncbi:hypothetical protein Dimus_001593 [Dionaea muscipula]
MCKLTRENGIWWIGSGENRRRDDVDAPEVEEEEEDERNKDDFDWEAVIDEATVEGESSSGERFYDAEDETQGSPEVQEEIPAAAPQSSAQQKDQTTSGVDPRVLRARIPGENKRRDNDVDAPEEEAEKEDERNKDDFDWEAVINEATVEGESGSDNQFYDAQVEVEEPMMKLQATQRVPASSSAQQKDNKPSGVDPSCPTDKIPDAEFLKFQAEFERKRANRFHDDLEKAKAENARLLALLHQAQTKPILRFPYLTEQFVLY